jgi:hypothetical protein
LKDIAIPEGITSIGNYAFSGCERLTELTIPENVTSIGKGAFDSCKSLISIYIPKDQKIRFTQNGLLPYENLLVERNGEDICILLNLAQAFEKGIGVVKSIEQAAIHYTQAADSGSAEAAYHMGELYENGMELPQDYQQAIEWYKKATILYHPLANTRKMYCEHILQGKNSQLLQSQKKQQ